MKDETPNVSAFAAYQNLVPVASSDMKIEQTIGKNYVTSPNSKRKIKKSKHHKLTLKTSRVKESKQLQVKETKKKKQKKLKTNNVVSEIDFKKSKKGKLYEKKVKKMLLLQSKKLGISHGISESPTVKKSTNKVTFAESNSDVLIAPKIKTKTIDLNLSTHELEISNNGKLNNSSKRTKLAASPKVQTDRVDTEVHNDDSSEMGLEAFRWMLDPVFPEQFFSETWEKRAIHVKRNSPQYYNSIMSSEGIDQALRQHSLHFGRNIDVTSYVDSVRDTLNPVGRALPAMVWDYYGNGCSVRLLNPHTYFRKLYNLNAMLQEYFGCYVGANAYLTPADSQGFAPHYDDIEAFVLQIEGKKHWKLYSSRNKKEVLPRVSSRNFTEEEMSEPMLDIVLEAGDLLYFPRGTIHQARSLPDTHSLHITISMYQKTSWADLLEKLIPAALSIAIENDSEYREGLPLHYLNHVGVVHSERQTEQRNIFFKKLQGLISKMFKHAPVDGAVDQLARQFQHDALPPILTPQEKQCMVYGDGDRIQNNGQICNKVEIDLDTHVRLTRKHILRLVVDDDAIRLYHSIDNSKEYHGEDPQFLEINNNIAPGVEKLVLNYPQFMRVEDLPIDDDIEKLQLVSDLWERGLLVTSEPLNVID